MGTEEIIPGVERLVAMLVETGVVLQVMNGDHIMDKLGIGFEERNLTRGQKRFRAVALRRKCKGIFN